MSPTEMVMAEMKETINSLKAENEELKLERDSEERWANQYSVKVIGLESQIYLLKAENEKLKAAMKVAKEKTILECVNSLKKEYKGFKGLVSYEIASEVLRVNMKISRIEGKK